MAREHLYPVNRERENKAYEENSRGRIYMMNPDGTCVPYNPENIVTRREQEQDLSKAISS